MIEFVLHIIMILLTLALIPFAFKTKSKKMAYSSILLPLVANTIFYIVFNLQPAFGYLAIIGVMAFFLKIFTKQK